MGASTKSDFVVGSNGHCFFCLSQIVKLEPDPNLSSPLAKQINSLQYLTRYLKMDLRKVFINKGQVSPELLDKVGKARLKVELCEECSCLSETFSKIYRQLEKLELELGSTLRLVHGKLASADAAGKLLSLTSCLNSNWNGLFEVVDVLRAEATQKCSHMLAETPRVKIQNLTQMEVEAKQSMLQNAEECLQMATNAEDVLHRGLETNAVKIESPTEDSLSDHENESYFSEDFNSNLCSETINGYMKIERELNEDDNDNILPQGQGMMISNKKGISRPKRNTVLTRKCSINPETGKRKCNDCSKEFNSAPAFRSHYQTVHLKLRYNCVSCNKLFSSKSSLTQHERTSRSCSVSVTKSNHKSKCHLCEKSFSRKDYLNDHLEGVHYKLRKYACDLCGKKFNVKTKLGRHKRKVHGLGTLTKSDK